MRIGVPRESYAGEKRVATTPEVAAQLMKLGYEVVVESQAGAAANFADAAYEAAGCRIAPADEVWTGSDIILKVRAPPSPLTPHIYGPSLLSGERGRGEGG